MYADGFRFAATTEQICLVRVAVGMTFALSAGVLFRGYYAGNTTPIQPLRIRRHSVGRYLRDCGGDCVLPLYGDRNFHHPLAAIVVFRLDIDAADCAVRSTGNSESNEHLDARRLNLAELVCAAPKCLKWVKNGRPPRIPLCHSSEGEKASLIASRANHPAQCLDP